MPSTLSIEQTANKLTALQVKRPSAVQHEADSGALGQCDQHCESDDPRTSLLAAIAFDLSRTLGGALFTHLDAARQLLEEAFRAVEQADRVGAVVPARMTVAQCA